MASPHDALAATVTLNTASLANVDGRLAFDLFDGDGAANNSVVISNITSNGTFAGTDCSIGCSGGPLTFTLTDAFGFGELLYDFKLGTTLSFDLSYTTNFAGAPGTDPDRFGLFLLSPDTNFSLVSTNLQGDALLTVDLIGAGILQTATNVSPTVGVAVAAVPEPGSLALTAVALLAWVARRRSPAASRACAAAD